MDFSDWLELATAVGTIGAAVLAGVAARVAARAADASRELVLVERQRDKAAFEAELWRQARRVTVDTRGQHLLDHKGDLIGWDVSTVVTNSSADPISKARIKIACHDERWGPQLVGTIASGDSVEVVARIFTTSRDLNGYVRFVDVEGRAWVANSQTGVVSDDELDLWLEEGAEFAQRDLDPLQRGTLMHTGSRIMPDFDGWAAEIESRGD